MSKQKYMKNVKTGVIFIFDEEQVSGNAEMVECTKDGKIVVNADQTEENVVAQQAAKIEENAKVIEVLTKQSAEDTVTIENLRTKVAEGGASDDSELVAENAQLKESIAKLQDQLSEALKTPEAPAPTVDETPTSSDEGAGDEPKSYSKDEVEALYEQARELGIRGFTKMEPAILEAAIAAKKQA